MVLASLSILVVAELLKFLMPVRACSQSELQLSPAALEGLSRSARGLTQAPFNLLALHWVSAHVRLCVCVLQEWNICFLQTSTSSVCKPC